MNNPAIALNVPPRSHLSWERRYTALLATLPDMFRTAARDYPYCSLYLYFKRAVPDGAWGEFLIVPQHMPPPTGFELATGSRLNAIPYDHLPACVRAFSLPVIGGDNE